MNIDISIVTYNSSKWLEDFFKSLLSQNYSPKNLNIYIRDNGSIDNTVLKLKQLEHEYGKNFSAFVISEGSNIGFGAGHNFNFKKGQSPFFLVTNIDLVFEKNAIIEVMAAAEKDQENIASVEFRQKPYENLKYYDPVTLETRWSSSVCVLFRRDAFEKIGGYEERIFLYGEDVEISYRLRDNGYKLLYCPKAVCWHYSYAKKHELKTKLIIENIVANAYLRLRYGNFFEAVVGFFMMLVLCRFKNMFYFLSTRKKSNIKFMFIGRDYDYRREGAFYTCPPMPDEKLPLVSVITRTCPGRLEWLKKSVASTLNQTYSAIELIIVEDGGNSAEDFSKELKNVIYCSIKKSGRSVAGNKGLALAKGEYVVFLDDDDVFFADHIENLALKLKDIPSCGAAYAIGAEFTDNPAQPVVVYHQAYSRQLLLTRNYLPIQTVLFRRSLYLEKGGFDPAFDALEDWDLWLRYSENRDFIYVDKLTSLYRISSSPREVYARKKIFLETYPRIRQKHNITGLKSKSRTFMNKILMSSYGIFYLYWLIK